MAGIENQTPLLGTTGGFNSVVLKEFYLGPIRDILNSSTVLSRIILKDEESISGKYAVIPLRTERNEAIVNVDENAFLPDAQTQGYAKTLIPMRWLYGRILFTGQVIAMSRNDRGAFAEAADSEVSGLAIDMKKAINRQLFHDGSGRLCQVTAIGAAPTYSVANPGGFTNGGNGTKYLRPKMVCACISAAGTLKGTAKITSVNASAGTVTFANSFSAAGGAVVNDYLVLAAQDGAGAIPTGLGLESTAWNKEMMGLAGIVNDADPPAGAFQGIVSSNGSGRSNNPAFQANVIDAASTALDLDVMQQAIDVCEQQGDGVPKVIILTHGLRRSYLDNLVPDKQFVNTLEMDGGFRTIEFNMIPVVPDVDATYGRMYFLDTDTLAVYRMSDYFWIDHDGSILLRLPNKDSYQATLALYAEMGCTAPNRSAVITNLLEP